MSEAHGWKSFSFVSLVLVLQIALYFVVYANVPIARMVLCFFYLMFVPGITILKLLEMKNLDTAEKALFSTGLSIAFLMLISLIINDVGRLAFTNPLSLNLLLISINTVVLLISLIAIRRDGSARARSLPRLPQLKRLEWLFSILLIISLFASGSYGAVMANTSSLLLLLIAISIAVSLVFVSERILSIKLYPLILIAIFLSLLFFSGPIITKYIGGSGDGPIEFYAFRLTETKGYWDAAAAPSPYTPILFPTYSMASVTILPAVFTVISGLDGSSVFQLLYPLIVAFLALGSYKLYQTQTDNRAAFLATFFLITVSIGKGLGSYKQEVAQLFYVSLFLLLLKKDLAPSKRNVLFIIFGAGLVLSHYGLAYIFLLTILFAFLILILMDYTKKGHFSTSKMPLSLVLIFSTIAFLWYIFANSSATFNLLTKEVNTVTSSLSQFFNPASRGTALQGLGVVQTPTILNRVSSLLFIFTEFLLVLGFIRLMTSKDKTSKFSSLYKVFAALNMAIIGVNILLPTIADTFLMERFYQTTLIILAPLAVLGGKTIIDFMPKLNFRKLYASLLVFIVFIPLFLFQTGLIYEVAKVQTTSPISTYRWTALELYGNIVDEQEVASAQWIPTYANVNNIFIYSDPVSQTNALTAYGMVGRGRMYTLSNTTTPNSGDFIYLANVSLISKGYIFNASQVSPILENQNKIYDNGECEIYKGCTP
jgi:uncharacterized membrane protein